MSERRPDPDAFRDAVLSRLDQVEPETSNPRLDRDARRAIGAVVCVVVLVGAGALLTRWFEEPRDDGPLATTPTSIEGAFQRLSVDPVDDRALDGNHRESATESPDGRYEEVVAAAPGRST